MNECCDECKTSFFWDTRCGTDNRSVLVKQFYAENYVYLDTLTTLFNKALEYSRYRMLSILQQEAREFYHQYLSLRASEEVRLTEMQRVQAELLEQRKGCGGQVKVSI